MADQSAVKAKITIKTPRDKKVVEVDEGASVKEVGRLDFCVICYENSPFTTNILLSPVSSVLYAASYINTINLDVGIYAALLFI